MIILPVTSNSRNPIASPVVNDYVTHKTTVTHNTLRNDS